MGYGKALLYRDYTAEKIKLEDDEEALAKKAGKKSLWGSVGGALGGLLAMGLTGGTAAPLVAAAMSGGGTALGGLLGQKLSGTGKIDPKSISGGKFLSSSRKDVKESFKDVDKELFQGAIVGGLTSGLQAGMGQYAKLALDARRAEQAEKSAFEIANIKKGVGFGESFKTSWIGEHGGTDVLHRLKQAKSDLLYGGDLTESLKNYQFGADLGPDITAPFEPSPFSNYKPTWDRSIYRSGIGNTSL